MNDCPEPQPTNDLVAAAEQGVVDAAVTFVEWLADPPSVDPNAHPIALVYGLLYTLARSAAPLVHAVTRLEAVRAATAGHR